jgi:hypothetical protein
MKRALIALLRRRQCRAGRAGMDRAGLQDRRPRQRPRRDRGQSRIDLRYKKLYPRSRPPLVRVMGR